MDYPIVIMIAIGLAMDCFAISMSCGLTLKDFNKFDALKIGIFFGGFQSGMALLGWFGGIGFAGIIKSIDHWVAFVLLILIGCKMIYEAIKGDDDKKNFNVRNLRILIILSIATSIDALAIGISFALLNFSMVVPIIIIGIISFLLAILGSYLGDKLGHLLGRRFEIIGGIILIIIGFKILIEHIYF
jgi:putative Mn2+ efflux pump MntP